MNGAVAGTPLAFVAKQNVGKSLDPIVQWLGSFHAAYPVVGVLLVLMATDIAMGYGAAFVTKTVSSTACWSGMVRKVMTLLLVGACAAIEPYASDLPLSKLAGIAFIVVEFTSIIENSSRAGVPIPPIITETLAKLRRGEKASVHRSFPSSTANIHIDRASNVELSTQDSQIVVNRKEGAEPVPKPDPKQDSVL